MFSSRNKFDKLLDKATNQTLLEPDWPSTIEICDMVRQGDVAPKVAMAGVKKKLGSTNPHGAMFALHVLESLVKNCGSPMQDELLEKVNCEMLKEIATTSPHMDVRKKMLELIEAWSFAFRKNSKSSALQEAMNAMKDEGTKFPSLRESDAMFVADSAPKWDDGEACSRCRVTFTLILRKHHCRNCGQVFCAQCSQKTASLPKYGIEKEVRVCDACFDKVTKPSSSKAKPKVEDSELPPEYVNSSLAQQSQVPPRKTEEELREEEELQLALALSQSEAEAHEKSRTGAPRYGLPKDYKETQHVKERTTPSVVDDHVPPEMARYLDRSYWENRQTSLNESTRPISPSAPATAPIDTSQIGSSPTSKQHHQQHQQQQQENGVTDIEMNEFIATLKSQVEIFINRMKSNSSRGRSIANDSSVQTLFMNITAMHSKLLRYIQQHDDSRQYFERLQDKLVQIKDARDALDALREEHREKLRREAEEAERQRQLQMAHKLDIMRKKKQEYLQYERQVALLRIQEQEREMKIRQEQQKQQYLMAATYDPYVNSPPQPAMQQQQQQPLPFPAAAYPYGVPMGMAPAQHMAQAHMQQPPAPQGSMMPMAHALQHPGMMPGALPQQQQPLPNYPGQMAPHAATSQPMVGMHGAMQQPQQVYAHAQVPTAGALEMEQQQYRQQAQQQFAQMQQQQQQQHSLPTVVAAPQQMMQQQPQQQQQQQQQQMEQQNAGVVQTAELISFD